MSEKNETEKPAVRADEPELSDDALEQVAGGCQWGDSGVGNTINTIGTIVPTLPTEPTVLYVN